MNWMKLTDKVRSQFNVIDSASAVCKKNYYQYVAQSPCFQNLVKVKAYKKLISKVEDMHLSHLKQLLNSTAAALSINHIWNLSHQLCHTSRRDSVKIQKHESFLTSFHEPSLQLERAQWKSGLSRGNDLSVILEDLLTKAKRGLKVGPYSVIHKLQTPAGSDRDKRYYFSYRPYLWPFNLLPKQLQTKVRLGQLKLDPPCCLHRDGHRVPGSVIGGVGENNFDRSSAWYVVDNVTTLALAWYFTGDTTYAKYGAYLVDVYFLNETTGMYPTLQYAQDGYKYGLIDWKDMYYFLDALTMLEQSGEFSPLQVKKMVHWCSELGHWILRSNMGNDEARALNNHGLYFDMSTLSLFLYTKEEHFINSAKQRLLFRLTKPYPFGHFAVDGSQPHELNRPTGLHYITFNLVGWMHAAAINEAARMQSDQPGSELSLWLVKHENEAHNPASEPVLCKAIRWLIQYLPVNTSTFERYSDPVDGMGVSWPYEQADAFAFDRMLEILRYGVSVYGLQAMYPTGEIPQNVRRSLQYPLYSTKLATYTKYSSVHPDSGSRAWNALGVINMSKPLPYVFS